VDPIPLVIAALAAGALAGTKDTAAQAVRDAYAGLKALASRRLAGNREALGVLELSERQPGAEQVELAQYLGAAGAADDEELIRAAQAVLSQAHPAEASAGKYDVRISGGKGIVVGDAATVNMIFSDRD
jgi:hypothetical protein